MKGQFKSFLKRQEHDFNKSMIEKSNRLGESSKKIRYLLSIQAKKKQNVNSENLTYAFFGYLLRSRADMSIKWSKVKYKYVFFLLEMAVNLC